MSPALLDEKIVAIARALGRARVPHAFGGALSLAYYAAPRGTVDIDLNVFVAAGDTGAVEGALAALRELGVRVPPNASEEIRERGQLRVRWEHTPLDLFFSYDPLHDACMRRAREVPFGDDAIRVLAPEDLVVFKTLFDRPKDWRDIEDVLFALGPELDAEVVRDWVARILEPDDARRRRLEGLLAAPPA